MAQALAVRVRFPAWSASVRSRHLPIVICRSSDIRCARLRTASTKFVRKRGLCGQSRSSTAIEHPKKSGDMGSIPIGRANLDGPLSLGYR